MILDLKGLYLLLVKDDDELLKLGKKGLMWSSVLYAMPYGYVNFFTFLHGYMNVI